MDGEGPTHCRWCHPWASGLRFYKKGGWAGHRKRVSKDQSSMVSESASASRFLTCLSYCSDYLQWWTITWKFEPNDPSPPQIALVMVFQHSNSNPNHTHKKTCIGFSLELQDPGHILPPKTLVLYKQRKEQHPHMLWDPKWVFMRKF